MRTAAIGIQDFETIIKNSYFYVDKTDFIREWWEGGDSVTLITRPRRFGKTLSMSMVEQFFSTDYAGRSDLFEGLAVWRDEKYRKLQKTTGDTSCPFLEFCGYQRDKFFFRKEGRLPQYKEIVQQI